MDLENYEKCISEMRSFVLGGATDIAWRLQQLELLRSLLIEEKDAIFTSLDEDLGTSADEGQAMVLQLCPLLLDSCHLSRPFKSFKVF